MAHFRADVPKELINQFEVLLNNSQQMIDDMVQAGAEIVLENVRKNMPPELKKYATSRTFHTTKVYTTPSDGGRNCGIWFGGYMKDLNGDVYKSKYESGGYTKAKAKAYRKDAGTPIELVANMFEYGSKQRKYPKHPFLRKSFHKRDIERAMLKAQKKYIKEEGNLK